MGRLRGSAGGALGSALVATAGVGGALLALVFAVTAFARRSKPLHPVGVVAPAVLDVWADTGTSGSPMLDGAGTHECLVRASYAVGSGPRHRDIEGFALRVLDAAGGHGPVDVLFAGTGTGPLSRYVLRPRAAGEHGTQTTLLPVAAEGSPLQLRLDPLDPHSQPWPARYRLSWAHGRGPWRALGTLAVFWGAPADAPRRFDPVVNALPGTTQYAAVSRLREPAYRAARLAWPRAGTLQPAADGSAVMVR